MTISAAVDARNTNRETAVTSYLFFKPDATEATKELTLASSVNSSLYVAAKFTAFTTALISNATNAASQGAHIGDV